MNGARWVWRCGDERGGLWRKGKGVETVGDWIVADMVEGVSEGTVRTASPCSAEKVNATVDAFAGKYRWACFGSEMVCVDVAWKLVLEDCGMVIWGGVLD